MRLDFQELLRGRAGDELELEVYTQQDGHVVEGVLREADGYWYPVIDGVPCFLRGALRPPHTKFRDRHGLAALGDEQPGERAQSQLATNTTFSDKWRRFRDYGLQPQHQEFLFEWYCKKLGVPDLAALEAFYGTCSRILECGPGSGFNSRFMSEHCPGTVVALDISDAAFTTFENTRDRSNCHVVQADLNDAPFDDQSFDFIIADGVLHHTPDTRRAVEALYRKLAPGGRFFFYVYRQMGPLRRYADEFVRESFTRLEPEACYAACEGFTELGRELSALDAKVTLTKGIPVLGIPPGTHDVQRLVYYNIVKCFWNDAFDFETNNMVNFDWYHPHDAWQHTEDEVRGWLTDLGVAEFSFHDSNPNGISVLLRRTQ